MKADIDRLMQEKNLDALMVLGNADHNPPMYHLTGGGHVTDATLLKRREAAAVLFCNDMERDEALKSGLEVVTYRAYDFETLLKEANGDAALAFAMRYQRMFADQNIRGRVGVYGNTDLSSSLAVITRLQKLMPEIEFVGETRNNSLFMQAMETKDEVEVARIRKMGQVTSQVVGRVAEYLTGCRVRQDEVLLNESGAPLTIEEVKGKINLWIAELGGENPEGTIFAIGGDAGVPHSAGTPSDLLRLGQTIVFDIFPCETGGGYFYDFTRTWTLGYATPAAQKLYDEVKTVYDKVVRSLRPNAPYKDYQLMACEEFEKNGHPTPLHTPAPTEGYVHSIGHGLGLNVHERPWANPIATEENLLKPGVVITIEPGLYYPDQNMGIRIEDTYWVRPDGEIELLADYPYDFVLRMK